MAHPPTNANTSAEYIPFLVDPSTTTYVFGTQQHTIFVTVGCNPDVLEHVKTLTNTKLDKYKSVPSGVCHFLLYIRK